MPRSLAPAATGAADVVTLGALRKSFALTLFESDVDCVVGDGTLGVPFPAEFDGYNLVDFLTVNTGTVGTTGTMDVQIRRRRAGSNVDVLSTKATIDSGEVSSLTAATPLVINGSNDDVATADLYFFDVDQVHSGTAAKGLAVVCSFELP